MALVEEMRRDEPDLNRVATAIQSDPGLAGAMLKVVNSPSFGLARKATSVSQALGILGLRNISNIASGVALRQSMNQSAQGMERFWDTAEKVALICAELARRLRGIPHDEAYTVGLFHDCGIPLLMQRHPNYREVLALANNGGGTSFQAVEEEQIGTHHCAVGYFIARSWHLPETISQAILWHHHPDAFNASAGLAGPVRNFIALLHFAEHIHHTRMRSQQDAEWSRFGEAVLAHFALTDEDFLTLMDTVNDALSESDAAP